MKKYLFVFLVLVFLFSTSNILWAAEKYDSILDNLKSTNPTLFLSGIKELEKEGSYSNEIIEIVTLKLVSKDTKVKKAAFKYLSSLETDIIPILASIMEKETDQNSFLGYEIIDLVSSLGVEESLPVLKKALNNPNPEVRKKAVNVLASCGKESVEVVPVLCSLLSNSSEDDSLRIDIATALAKISVITPQVKSSLALSIGSNNPKLAWAASKSVKRLGIDYNQLMFSLVESLGNKDEQKEAIQAITRTVKKIDEPVLILKNAFEKSNKDVKIQIIKVINLISKDIKGDSKYRPERLLRQALNDNSDDVRLKALYFLGESGFFSEKIKDELIKISMAQNESKTIRGEAVCTLEKAPVERKLISYFTKLIIDETASGEMRMVAARYLGNAGSAASYVVDHLLKGLTKMNEEIRWRISPAFYQIALENGELITKLNDLINTSRDDKIKLYAANILSSLGKRASQSVDNLFFLAKNGNYDLQLAALNALKEIAPDNPKVLALFKECSTSKDKNIKRIALQGLKKEDKLLRFETKIPAFPGAEGYGKYTIGGRGGRVYIVTNLNDKGPGSLRAAVEAKGPRTIVFAIAGNIMLEKPLNIENPYLTIAGQTAPGDGITVAGAPVKIKADNVMIRYMRFRMGNYNNIEDDSIGGRYVSNIILDHISASWSTDECVSFYLTNNVTVQWSFITESLRKSVHQKGAHGYGGIWGGASSFHHNLLAHHSSRNPRFDGERDLNDPAVDMRNNVIYNWGFNSTYGGENGNHNIIANYYKPGPATKRGDVNHRIVEVSDGGKWYVADNYVAGHSDVSADNWSGGVQPDQDSLSEIKSDNPFPVPEVTTHSAGEAYKLVLARAGDTLPTRDAIDKRIAREVENGTATYGGKFSGSHSGLIDSQEDVGGLPFLRRFPAAVDSDQDGLPDWWVIKYGFNPVKGIKPAEDLDGDGYTNIEEYLNGTNPNIAESLR